MQQRVKRFRSNQCYCFSQVESTCQEGKAWWNIEGFIDQRNVSVDHRFNFRSQLCLFIQKRGLCFNCLNRGHRVAYCRKRHHILLYREESVSQELSEKEPVKEQANKSAKGEQMNGIESSAQVFLTDCSVPGSVILPAALVYVFGRNGHRHFVRAFLDSSGGINAISERLGKRLQSKIQNSSVSLSSLVPGNFLLLWNLGKIAV